MEGTNPLLDAAAIGDLVLLDPLSEDSLLRTLRERFRRGDIYVGTGMGLREAAGRGGAERGVGVWVPPAAARSILLPCRRTSGTC